MDDKATRWLRAAGVRALKTAAQAAVALIGTFQSTRPARGATS